MKQLFFLFFSYLLINLCSFSNSLYSCQQGQDNCILCLSSQYCPLCQSGYFSKADGIDYKCFPCEIGCKHCQGSTCLVCYRGWELVGSKCLCRAGKGINILTQTCTACSIPSCLICQQDHNICTQCNPNLGLLNNTCIPCGDSNCQKCLQADICNLCYPLFGLLLDACQPCSVVDCQICTDANICERCKPGFGFAWGTCQPCVPANCDLCFADYNRCQSCTSSYGVQFMFHSCVVCSALNCQICSTDKNKCSVCTLGFGFDSDLPTDGICKACKDQYCQGCHDYRYCSSCQIGFILFNGSCTSCLAVSNCAECSTATVGSCSICSQGFGIALIGCSSCMIDGCISCSSDSTQCTKCKLGQGFDGLFNLCQNCSIQDCMECGSNYAICEGCNDNKGLTSIGTCQSCSTPGCSRCPKSKDKCAQCSNRFGLDRVGSCITCLLPHCLVCSKNYLVCNLCEYGYTQNGRSCQVCQNDQTFICQNDITQSNACIENYGVNSNGVCVKCEVPNCYYCDHGVNLCTVCNSNYGVTSTGGQCELCLDPNCVVCSSNSSVCTACSHGHNYNGTNCLPCTISNCADCYADINICNFCVTGYELRTETSPNFCYEICGDSFNINLECDLPVGVAWDGCSDSCEIENDFECETIQNASICSFNNNLTYTFVSIQRISDITNELKFVVKVFPPLLMFTNSNLLPVFQLSPSIKLTKVNFDQSTATLIFYGDFDKYFSQQTSLTLKFTPSNQTDQRYFASIDSEQTFAMPTSNQEIFVYYDTSKESVFQFLNLCAYATVAIAWISFFFGLFMRKLAGLQAIMTLQLIYLNILWFNSYFYLPLTKLFPLKYIVGLNLSLFGSTTNNVISSKAPFTSQFFINTSNFIDNFNFMFLFQIVAAISLLFAIIRMKIFMYNNSSNFDFNDSPEKLKYQSISKHSELSLQCLLYFSMLNLLNQLNCAVIFLTSSNPNQMMSIVFLAITVSCTLLVFCKFFTDPDPFDFFRYSFRILRSSKLQPLCFNHSLLLCFTLSLTFLLISLLTTLSFLPLIPLLLILLYSLIVRPYQFSRQNVRSIFNIFVLCLVSVFRIFLVFGPSPFIVHPMAYPLIIVVFSILPLTVALWGLFFLIYEFIRQTCFPYSDEQLNNQPFSLLKKSRNQFLWKLQGTQVRKRMKQIHQNSENGIFKKIVSPQVNLLEYSNQLFEQALESQKQLMKDTKKAPVNLEGLKSQGKRHRLNLNLQKIGETKKIQNNCYTLQLQKIIQEQETNDNKKALQQKLVNSTTLANQVLSNENKFVNYKGSVEYVENKVFRLESPNKNIYLQIYDDMKLGQYQKSEGQDQVATQIQ